MTELVLKNEFDVKVFRQISGTDLGINFVPPCA